MKKMDKFAENLKMLRKGKKLSQQDLALQIHFSQQSISQWEQGLSEPTLSALWILSDIFEISVDELIGKTDLE